MATRVGVLDGGGPKDSENTLNSFLTKRDEDGFWQIGTDMWKGSNNGYAFYKAIGTTHFTAFHLKKRKSEKWVFRKKNGYFYFL